MTSLKHAVIFAGMSLAAAFLVTGCGGPDNEANVSTTADGKVQKETSAGSSSSAEEYNAAAAKAQQSGSQYQTKGYPKKQ